MDTTQRSRDQRERRANELRQGPAPLTLTEYGGKVPPCRPFDPARDQLKPQTRSQFTTNLAPFYGDQALEERELRQSWQGGGYLKDTVWVCGAWMEKLVDRPHRLTDTTRVRLTLTNHDRPGAREVTCLERGAIDDDQLVTIEGYSAAVVVSYSTYCTLESFTEDHGSCFFTLEVI